MRPKELLCIVSLIFFCFFCEAEDSFETLSSKGSLRVVESTNSFFEIQKRVPLCVLKASDDSLSFKEFDSFMRAIKETVWKNDFSSIAYTRYWTYEGDSPLFSEQKTEWKETSDREIIKRTYDVSGFLLREILESTKEGVFQIERIEYTFKDGKKNESKRYKNDVLIETVLWKSDSIKEQKIFLADSLEIRNVFEDGMKKSETVYKNEEKIGEKIWE